MVIGLAIYAPLLMGHHPGFPGPLDMEPVGEEWVLVATPGFISAAEPTELICKEAFGADGALYAAVLGSHHFAMETSDGMAVTFDGCDVDRFHPLEGQIADLSARGDRRLAVVSRGNEGDHLQWSVDGGDNLVGSLRIDPDLSVTAVDWFDDRQIVMTAYDDTDFSTRGPGHLIVVDIDDNTFYVEAMDEALRFPYLMATGADQVVSAVRVEQRIEMVWGPLDDPTRHSVEIDVWPLRADIAEDGTIYIVLFAIYADWVGVAIATEDGLVTDPRLSDRDIRCAVADADGLWFCSSGVAEGYEVWRVDGDDEPEPFYRLAYLEGPRTDCPDDSAVAQVCPHHWEHIRDEIPRRSLDVDTENDDDEMVDEPQDSVDLRRSSDEASGCKTSGGSPLAPLVLLVAAIVFVAVGRRRLLYLERKMQNASDS